jgi:hypothetical protein
MDRATKHTLTLPRTPHTLATSDILVLLSLIILIFFIGTRKMARALQRGNIFKMFMATKTSKMILEGLCVFLPPCQALVEAIKFLCDIGRFRYDMNQETCHVIWLDFTSKQTNYGNSHDTQYPNCIPLEYLGSDMSNI